MCLKNILFKLSFSCCQLDYKAYELGDRQNPCMAALEPEVKLNCKGKFYWIKESEKSSIECCGKKIIYTDKQRCCGDKIPYRTKHFMCETQGSTSRKLVVAKRGLERSKTDTQRLCSGYSFTSSDLLPQYACSLETGM